jgi:hypothetical protein
MPNIDKIFAAADRQRQSLAEYLKHNYSDRKLDDLECSIRTQLDSLNSEISDFMAGIEVPRIENNLVCASDMKLDTMQSRLMDSLHEKQVEFEQMLGPDGIETHLSILEDASVIA